MTRGSAWKIVASVVVVTGAVGFLLSRSLKEGAESYKHVHEVMANIDSLRGKRLQVHGNVVDGSIEQVKGTLQFRFQLESGEGAKHSVISANYTGLVPDTFKSGAEVVARGTLTAGDRLDVIPDGIMAKCPSKYEVGKAGAPPAAAAAGGPASPTKSGIDPNVARQL